MSNLVVDLPNSLNVALDREVATTKCCASTIVAAALGQYLGTPVHTIFQVSTSGALVAGVYSGAVDVKTVLNHGDFGLGTFANLDGEMVVLDGLVYQVQGTGLVSLATPDAKAPFAVVTRFSPEVDTRIAAVNSFKELTRRCDDIRSSGNIFYAFRLKGPFSQDLISFGPFRLSVTERVLEKEGVRVRLGSRALDILIALVERPAEVVSKKELFARAWPDLVVDEGNLRYHVSALRKALGEGRSGGRYVTNVSGRGYCFVAPISRSASPPASLSDSLAHSPVGLPLKPTGMVGREDTVQRISEELIARRFFERRRFRRDR
jgi:DNA-binding winged helix-turn-helix (wHTH) protein